MRNNDPRSIIFFIVAAVIFGQAFSGGFIPVIIAFFIFRSMFSEGRGRNRSGGGPNNRRNSRDRRYREREQTRDYRRQPVERTPRQAPRPKPTPTRRPVKKNNPFRKSGIEKFKEYDYEGAIEDFKKALQVDSKDKAVHFNLACGYSLTEQKDKAYFHLNKAVENGFVDFEKIKTHDALAYLRIQDEFEAFAKSGYNWPLKQEAKAKGEGELITNKPDLLEQLKQLGELRDKGLLTEAEFAAQKEKLMR